MNTPAIIFPSLLDQDPSPTSGDGSDPRTAPRRGEELVVGADGRLRPSWVGQDPVLEDYYDNEGRHAGLFLGLPFVAGLG